MNTITRVRLLEILNAFIIGDGQEFPESSELEAAADALLAELRGEPVKLPSDEIDPWWTTPL